VSATNGHFVAVVVADGFPNTNRSAFIYPLNKGRDPNWQHVLTDITELKDLNVECDSFPNPQHYPLPFLQTRPESSNLHVTSMCKFSPCTFYLRIPECDILCIRVPKINNLLRCVTT